ARIDPAAAASRPHRVCDSYDPWDSVYAPSSRFSGASCTSLLSLQRLCGHPVLRGTLTALDATLRVSMCAWSETSTTPVAVAPSGHSAATGCASSTPCGPWNSGAAILDSTPP